MIMNDKIYEDLLEFQKNKKIISIFRDTEDTEKFNVGYIIAIDDFNTIIQHISPNGMYDGYNLIKTGDIYQICYNGKYENKIQYLYSMQAQKHSDIVFSNENLAIDLLTFSKQNNLIVSLELHSSGIYNIQGIVLEINDDNVLIEQITDYGENDGVTRIDIECISKIVCDSDNEQALKKLLNRDK